MRAFAKVEIVKSSSEGTTPREDAPPSLILRSLTNFNFCATLSHRPITTPQLEFTQ